MNKRIVGRCGKTILGKTNTEETHGDTDSRQRHGGVSLFFLISHILMDMEYSVCPLLSLLLTLLMDMELLRSLEIFTFLTMSSVSSLLRFDMFLHFTSVLIGPIPGNGHQRRSSYISL